MFVTLLYDAGPRGCPDVEEFRANVGRQLGYDPFRPTADRHVVVQIGRDDIGFDGRIRWSDTSGRWVGDRRFSSRRADCSEIAASVAFAIAVQIQLMATLAPDSSQSAAPPPGSPTSPPVAPTPDTSATSPKPSRPVPSGEGSNPAGPTLPERPASSAYPESSASPASSVREEGSAREENSERQETSANPESRLRLALGIGPSLALGLAPEPAALGRVFVFGRISQFSLEVGVDASLPTTQRSADGSGFTLDRFSFGMAVCGHAGVFAACLTGTVGRMQVQGFGVDVPATPAGLFSQLGARIATTYEFGDLYFVSARIEPLVMLSSWTVTLDENSVWTAPPVGVSIGLDAGARFF
jgi:hypothetical protein